MERMIQSSWGFLGMPNWEDALGKTQDILVGLCLSFGFSSIYATICRINTHLIAYKVYRANTF